MNVLERNTIIIIGLDAPAKEQKGYQIVCHQKQGSLKLDSNYLHSCVDTSFRVGNNHIFIGKSGKEYLGWQPTNANFIDACLQHPEHLPERLKLKDGGLPCYICPGTEYEKISGANAGRRYVRCLLWDFSAWKSEFVPCEEVGADENDFIIMVPVLS